MRTNLMPKIAKLLGVELGEEFKVVRRGGSEVICDFTLEGLFEHDKTTGRGEYNKKLLAQIVCGGVEVVKFPWKPKKGERYYTFVPRSNDEKLIVTSTLWENDVADNALLKAGWVFKTEEEAQKALPIVAKEIGAKYELPNTKIVEPWKPKEGDTFYSFDIRYGKWFVCSYIWVRVPCDYALLAKGWIYRTCEEAKAALPAVAAELGVEYEL